MRFICNLNSSDVAADVAASGGPLMQRARARIGALVAVLLMGGALLVAQASAQTPPPPGDAAPTAAPLYSAPQLDQMLAPLALYPDDLLGMILMAATYPLEVVQADRWLQDPNNAALRGTALAQALQAEPWDTSIKSLVAYPQILAWMDSGLDWTETVGDAFLAQQADVMDSVQRLRARSRAAGMLSSTPQETVTDSGQAIQIASPDSGVEYVPVYNPDTAYGPWPNPDYPPDDFEIPGGYTAGTFIAFPIFVPYWGWDHWDWRHHRIDTDDGSGSGGPRHPGHAPRPVPWRHDPKHRGGVPYHDPVSRAKFEGTPDIHAVRSTYRGFEATRPEPAPLNRPAARPSAPPPAPPREPHAPVVERTMPPPEVRRTIPEVPRPEAPRPQAPRPEAPRFEMPHPAPAPVERPVAPALESFGRGAEVHAQEQRGFTSRASESGGGARGHR